MWKLIKFELLKMLKDKAYIIAFFAFFVYVLSIGILNYNEVKQHPEYANHFIEVRSCSYINDNEAYNKVKEFQIKNDYKGFLQFELDYLNKNDKFKSEEIKAVDEYCLKNNVVPQPDICPSQGLFAISDLGNEFGHLPLLIITFIAAIAFNKEYRGGTIKLIATQPFSRRKIVLSKYFATVIFTGVLLLFTLGVTMILNSIFYNFNDPNYPVYIMNNYLSSSFSSSYIKDICVPLWYFAILSAILLILMTFTFTAIPFLFSVLIKNRAICLCTILVITFMCINVMGRTLPIPISPFYPYSLCYVNNDLQGIMTPPDVFPRCVTFIDSVISFSSYTILCVFVSIVTVKHQSFKN